MKRLLLAFGCSFAWINPGAIAAPASTASGPASNAPKGPVLQKLYRKAMEGYDAKRYDEASDLFAQIVRQQPDHTPSKIFLARSLYQQKNMSDSYKIFKSIDIKALEPDAAYDFGQVADRSNDYSTAMKAFALVPNGHPLYDLAGFYGGICAYKLGEYQQSIDLFDQAVVLPSKLVRSQKLFRKEAEKKLLLKQKQDLQSGSSTASGRMASAELPAFVLNPVRGVSLVHRYMNQTAESKKADSTEIDLSRTYLRGDWGSNSAPAGSRSKWVYFSNLTAAAVKDAYKEVPVLPNADETLQFMNLQAYTPKSLIRVEGGAGYEMVIAEHATLGAVAGATLYAGDGDFTNKIDYSPYFSVFLAQKGDIIETRLTAEVHPRFNSDKLLVTQALQDASIKFNFSKKAYFGLTGQLNEYSYNVVNLEGPDWNGRFVMDVGYHQEKSLSLALGTFYETAPGWRLFEVTPEVPQTKFNLSQLGFFAKVDMSLASWLTIGISGRIVQDSTSNALIRPLGAADYSGEGAQAFLDENYSSKLSQFALYASFSKTF